MINITISQEEKDRFVDEAREKVVLELINDAKKRTSINSIIESSKSRLTNNIQKEIANRIVDSINIDQLIENAVNQAESLVQEAIKKSLSDGLLFRIKMDTTYKS